MAQDNIDIKRADMDAEMERTCTNACNNEIFDDVSEEFTFRSGFSNGFACGVAYVLDVIGKTSGNVADAPSGCVLMNPDKYIIEFDWRNPQGKYTFCQNWSTNSFIKFLFKFIVISLKYEIVDIQYRNCKE